MLNYLLDIRADPGFFEKHKSAKWLIIIAVLALAGLVAWYVIKRRREKNNRS